MTNEAFELQCAVAYIGQLERRARTNGFSTARDFKTALSALREKAERENPKPLTLDEIKQMDGEPVWTVNVSFTEDGKWAMWDIVESADNDGVEFGYSTESREWWNYNLRDGDGKLCGCAWLAYRHKPKEAQHE